jgi:shikimate kinase
MIAETKKRIFLTGVACVGKTAIGTVLADLFGYRFYDLDCEVEAFYGLSIERLQNRHNSMHDFRNAAAKVLEHILSSPESRRCVIALPPRGLMGAYWKVVKRTEATIAAIHDNPENILKRINFFDVDSRPIEKTLTDSERQMHLREIKADFSYFRMSYTNATMTADISGLNIEGAARKIKAEVEALS